MPHPSELKDSIIELSKKVDNDYLLKVDHGYLLEVDVSYPHDLHDMHSDLLFMCEKMMINGVKSWFPVFTTRKITSFTSWLSIKHSDTSRSWTRLIKQSSSTKAHG